MRNKGPGGLVWRWNKVDTAARVVCAVASVTAVCVMTSAKQRSTLSLFGFSLPLYSKWSFSDSFQYVVVVCAVVAVHSVVQLLLNLRRMARKSPPAPASRKHGWVRFAGDQILAYAMISAGSAASGVTNFNRTGIHHNVLPDFCNPLHIFCTRVAVSIALVFFTCFLLTLSVLLDVLSLSLSQY